MKAIDELAVSREQLRALKQKIERLRQLLLDGEETLKGDRVVGHIRQQIILTEREVAPLLRELDRYARERSNGQQQEREQGWDVV